MDKPKIGVYLCHCGSNIAGTVDVEAVTEFATALDGVAVARNYQFMCSDPGLNLIKEDIRNLGLNRVVETSCSPRMHEPTFRRACGESGLNPYLFQMAHIREHCPWITDESCRPPVPVAPSPANTSPPRRYSPRSRAFCSRPPFPPLFNARTEVVYQRGVQRGHAPFRPDCCSWSRGRASSSNGPRVEKGSPPNILTGRVGGQEEVAKRSPSLGLTFGLASAKVINSGAPFQAIIEEVKIE